MNEQYKYNVIKKLVDSNGNKKSAALKLNCSLRTINRLILKYKENGKLAFVHGNRERKPAISFDDSIKQQVKFLYKEHFMDTNFSHFTEILRKHYSISISDSTLNHWLREDFVLSPKARRSTKKNVKKSLKEMTNQKLSKKKIVQVLSSLDSIDNPHPRRPRSKYLGEMIQMDASSYIWFGDHISHLHVAIDDASGLIVGAYFDTQETLHGYYHVFHQILHTHGIPAMFYTDRRTVFEYQRKNAPMDNEDTFTQFSYACHQLGVSIKTSSVPQAKGRVERLNQTLQSRLPVELRLAGITTIKKANEFLVEYIKEYNQKFSLPINSTQNVFEIKPSDEKINQTLAILSSRKVDTGHCIRYKKKYYIPHTSKGTPVYARNKSDALVIEAYDGSIYVNILEELYLLEEVETRESYSREFDTVSEPKTRKKKYIPPMSHPWKHASYIQYQQAQAHRKDGAHV